MLERLQALLAYHVQAARTSLHALSGKPIAALMTILVIAIALALPSLFWVFTANISKLTAEWKNGGHIALYLKPGLNPKLATTLLDKVKTMPGVGQATFKSADQGLEELKQQEGMQEIMRYLPENPLPALIDVAPTLNIDSAAKLDLLARELQALPEVGEVKLDLAWINRLNAIASFATKVSRGLMTLLALAVVLIIGTTLRLIIHNRQEEIQVLKLVGATDAFILRPFLYAGIGYGLVGGLLAIFFVNIFMLSIGLALNKLMVVYQMHYPLTGLSISQILLLLSIAGILGWLGARLSVKGQLASIEPYD